MNKEYIDFVLVANIEGMHFQPHRPEGFEFKPNSDEEVRFILKPTDPEKDASGHWLGLTCKACKSYPASKDQILFVDAYNYKRKMLGVAESITLPLKRKRSDETLIFEDGTYCDGFHPRKHMCPTDMVELLNQVSSDLFTSVNRFVKLLRWRQLCDAPGELINHSSLYWRVDDGAYLMTPPDDSSSHNVTIQGMFGIHWSNKHADDLRNLWMDNWLFRRSLCHLFRSKQCQPFRRSLCQSVNNFSFISEVIVPLSIMMRSLSQKSYGWTTNRHYGPKTTHTAED